MSLQEGPPLPPICNVPHLRNPFFTGREDILTHLHKTLTTSRTAELSQAQAISGLSGIGKTQAAVEYIYRYGREYQAVLWARANSREVLVSEFVNIAALLDLPEKDEPDQNRLVLAVKRWLKDTTNWLLIFDNVEDFRSLKEFLPSVGRGYILLTTRSQITEPIAQDIQISKMEQEEGTQFLLRRAGIIEKQGSLERAFHDDLVKAREISGIMDGLPLALDQAGAYIYENKCSLSDYLDLYRTERADILKERGEFDFDHPEPVATTWSLSFKKVEQANPAAAELLRFCAFLHPDTIPLEILAKGADELGSVLQPAAASALKLNMAIKELLKFSLVTRNAHTQTLSIHRLVQAVLRDSLEHDTQRQWAMRTVQAIHKAFPQPEFRTWSSCQRCLPHVQVCATLINQWGIEFSEAADLLHRAGHYLQERRQYTDAEPLYLQALAIDKKVLGPEHLNIATTLDNLALLYTAQGRFADAEPLYLHALSIDEKVLGLDHPDIATTLNNLADFYLLQHDYAKVEPLYLRALKIAEKMLGPEHAHVATILTNLGSLYSVQSAYLEAEQLYLRALAIEEKTLGSEHPEVATTLNNLGECYYEQGRYTEAKQVFQRALYIHEQILKLEHPNVVICLNNLADCYDIQGEHAQAQILYERAIQLSEKMQH